MGLYIVEMEYMDKVLLRVITELIVCIYRLLVFFLESTLPRSTKIEQANTTGVRLRITLIGQMLGSQCS